MEPGRPVGVLDPAKRLQVVGGPRVERRAGLEESAKWAMTPSKLAW
jgi:hypothetical protein